ncbi:MAG: efflux RND transporter periplasmic adaptor subunit, partial [Hyphomicrobium sp.]
MSRTYWGLFLVAAAAAVGWWQGGHLLSSLKGAGSPAKQGLVKSGPIPVTVTEVKRGDFPVYLLGLGTVQPYRTVTIRSRVDGQI